MVSSNISHHSESNYVDHSIQVVKNAVITQDGHQNQRHSHHAHHGLNPSPCLAQLLIEPLLMIRRRSKDIFLLTIEPQHHHPLLRRIANFNSFLALNFSLKQVVHNVPSEVLQMFPLGPDINCC